MSAFFKADLDFENCFNRNCTASGFNASDWTDLAAALGSSDRVILAHFAAISAKLSIIDTRVSVVEHSLGNLVAQLPSFVQWQLGIDRVLATTQPILALYDTFR